ncbi:adenosylcobalamin-dependent ribonucleoside-diphosphate reductase [Candidatus Woesearchaeota archaeon]|nr:adenosylcobalamin-dependent ribonucleoside-diphosphate reductase [Candidatus Woesearchaeota archaeon]
MQIIKKDGTITNFELNKLTISIEKALTESQAKNPQQTAKKHSQEVFSIIEKNFTKELLPSTTDVRDLVVEILEKHKLNTTVKAYTAFKQREKAMIGFKTVMGVRDDIGMTTNALKVLAKRYLLRNEEGNIIETPARLFRRVAKTIASIDARYQKGSVAKTEETFYSMLSNLEFLPNTPTLMNAGTPIGQLAACFVLPVGDGLKDIFGAVEKMAIIHQSGGGTGFNFSNLRPKGDIVRSTKGVASGPVSFMTVFDKTTDVIKQGGKRRGANMAILNADHPDIKEFITSKTQEGVMTNFNISVAATDTFMEAVEKDKDWPLINPRTKKETTKINAKELFNTIVSSAWQTGDPGLVFIDEINRKNPTSHLGRIDSTNPCGEQPLHPHESCVLGSINLMKHVKSGKIDWDKLKKTVRTAIHFLDNVIDANNYTFPEIEQITKSNRRTGLGVMGFAEMLIRIGLPYNSDKALETAEKLMKFIADESHKKSQELGAERGSFPNFKGSQWEKMKIKTMRNATTTTIAPTGTISLIAGVSSGIEPLFAISFVRDVMEGTKLLEVTPLFEEIARQRGFYSKTLMLKVARKGTINDMKEIPSDVRKLFVTSFDASPEWHVKLQAAFQKFVDNAVSKTVNLPQKAKADDVAKIYLLAYKLKCKGITVYRTGSKQQQVLYIPEQAITVKEEFAGTCHSGVCTN